MGYCLGACDEAGLSDFLTRLSLVIPETGVLSGILVGNFYTSRIFATAYIEQVTVLTYYYYSGLICALSLTVEGSTSLTDLVAPNSTKGQCHETD